MGLRMLVTIVLLVIGWWLAHRIKQSLAKPKVVNVSDPTTCARVIACTGYDDTGAENLHDPIKSRTIPNSRLVRAFQIDNSFTTSSKERLKKFNKETSTKIKMTETEWQNVADFAKDLVREAVTPSNLASIEISIPLDSLIRSVCLKVVLHFLFRHEVELDNESISTITKSINVLWIQSKGTGIPEESDKNDLQKALAKVFPEREWTDPRESPLNLIMPAYETLWRVILSGFLEVAFVKRESSALRSVLEQFLVDPTVTARKMLASDPEASGVSVDHIVSEILRLYPSVKRVYRQFKTDDGLIDVAADIEACQRTEALWGPNAQHFDPSRWINVSKEARDSYMAFGASPFVCPAKSEFGPMMIGILVAVFADQIKSEDWKVCLDENRSDAAQRDFDKVLNGEVSLVSDRSTYEGIRIIKK